jgi:hypothetical protein
MDKRLRVHYYEEGDELNVLLGKPSECLYVEVDDEVYVRLDPATKEVVGFTIPNFLSSARERKQSLPLQGRFSLPPKSRELVEAA